MALRLSHRLRSTGRYELLSSVVQQAVVLYETRRDAPDSIASLSGPFPEPHGLSRTHLRREGDITEVRRLVICSLSAEAFAPYGDVLDASGVPTGFANGGAVEVHRDIAAIDVAAEGGRICVSVVRAKGATLPFRVEVMERHPLGSQVIAPLGDGHMLVVVAPHGPLDPARIVAFRASPGQGVNYRRGVWHHPLIALDRASDFLVIDRAGEGENLIVERLAQPLEVLRLD
jgi:ureidoglycolate lyase